jgi:heat shock protein HslJ
MLRMTILAMAVALAACSNTSKITSSSRATTTQQSMLTQYHWQLTQATNAQGQNLPNLMIRPDQPITLTFADGNLSVSNSCNNLGASFSQHATHLEVGAMRQTMMACADPALNQLDQEISARLQGKLALATTSGRNPTLTLTTASGDILSFTGQPTAETRFGSTGKIAFLEISPTPIACDSPRRPCLQVRDVYFDDNGLKVGQPSAWRALPQGVEGFVPEAGLRYVIRTKQFKVKNAPDAYVLDLVVESENTAPQS